MNALIDAIKRAEWPAPLRHVEMVDGNAARVILGPVDVKGEQRGISIHIREIENISKAVSEVTDKIARTKGHATP